METTDSAAATSGGQQQEGQTAGGDGSSASGWSQASSTLGEIEVVIGNILSYLWGDLKVNILYMVYMSMSMQLSQ